jgi:hypothetical protein
MTRWSVHADVREHFPDLVEFGWRHRAFVAKFIQACQPGERWHGGGEAEHRGAQALSFYVEVPQLRQAAQLL